MSAPGAVRAALAPTPPPTSPSGASRAVFMAGLGVGQIITWGTFYYSFPLIAEPMGHELGLGKAVVYGGATLGMAVAGAASYFVGTAIDRGRGREAMTLGCVLGGLVLLGWSTVHELATFYALFALMGLAQALTLYEPAFAIVARRYGHEARRGITALTLWGGFASTVFVPVIEVLVQEFGWRATLQVLGALHLVLCAGLHALLIDPRADAALEPAVEGDAPMPGRPPALPDASVVRAVLRKPLFWALALTFTLHAALSVGISLHLYPLLLERGLGPAGVVGAIALVGPSQVAGRILFWAFGRRASFRAVGMATVLSFPLALTLLLVLPAGFAGIALFACLYGATNGVMTILRGLAVPELLTRRAYGALNGLIALPSRIAAALAPGAAALLWSLGGSYGPVLGAALVIAALCALSFTFALLRSGDPSLAPAAPTG